MSARAALLLGSLVLAAALLPGPAQAQPAASEYEVKAAVLYNVVKFVEWPDDAFAGPADPIIVAVAGPDPFGGILERTVEGRLAQGRPLAIRRYRNPADLDFCHVLYVAAGEDAEGWLKRLRLTQVGAALSVGEGEAFADSGGTLTLSLDERRVRFEVNLEAASAAGLRISSRLLALASVKGQP
jgi:hypothetical protein